jgi:hypothetical protein
MLDQHRNPRYWTQIEPAKWSFNGWSTMQSDYSAGKCELPKLFVASDSLEYGREAQYITIGKGWP